MFYYSHIALIIHGAWGYSTSTRKHIFILICFPNITLQFWAEVGYAPSHAQAAKNLRKVRASPLGEIREALCSLKTAQLYYISGPMKVTQKFSTSKCNVIFVHEHLRFKYFTNLSRQVSKFSICKPSVLFIKKVAYDDDHRKLTNQILRAAKFRRACLPASNKT